MPIDREEADIRRCAFQGAIESLRMVSPDGGYSNLDALADVVQVLTDRFEAIIWLRQTEEFEPSQEKPKRSPLAKPAEFTDEDFEEEDTRPVCNACGTVLVHKTGVSKKTGKPWGAWMCSIKDCPGKPVWD